MVVLQLNQGNRTNFNRIKETEEADIAPSSEIDSSASSSFPANSYQMLSQATDTTNSAQASEYEDAESGASAFFFYVSAFVVNCPVCLIWKV